MYYTGRLLGIKNIPRERLYLYNRGDQCISVTGGWVSNTPTIFHEATYIQFNSSVDDGTKRISTVNNIDFTINDRLYIELETTANVSTTVRLAVFMTTIQDNSSRFRNLITGNYGINQVYFTPNVEKRVMFYHVTNWNNVMSLVNNYGFWKVREIYIDKYE